MLPLASIMKLNREDVEKIAHLARLKISDEEADMFAGQLSEIFSFIENLNQLNTDNIEPTSHTQGQGTPLRSDKVVSNAARDIILENAPDKEDTLFKVPKVI